MAIDHLSREESEFMKEHPWCMMGAWDEASGKVILCGKPGYTVVSMVSLVTKWDDVENWRTLCEGHYDSHLKG
ncbi:MAG TPA: hypothetical protein VHR84_16820 [Terriglobales bacterium]|jgi:hypothetical protein|nr:hypothetical protein [Terriglobales bacterium]